ncbi:MAG TPA: ABC transporter permease [Verrucomicrobiae bacterium]|nr:ABC transporter permease [Verrucomicrobiae bacterium]
MNPREVVRVALRALARNKLRTILTMLGIIIGVAAVICTVAIGQGASEQVQQQIASLGTNVIMVFSGSVNTSGVRMGSGATKTLTADDAMAVLAHVPGVVAVSPMLGSSVQAVNGNQNWLTRTNGASQDFPQIRNWPVVSGSFFSQRDVDMATNVCVIGKTVQSQLFGDQDPVGQMIRVQNLPFRILGVLQEKGQSSNGQDQDDIMFMPYTTVQKKISGISWIQMMMVATASQDVNPSVQSGISALLRQRHHLRTGEDDDFIIRNPSEMAQTAAATATTMTLLLGTVGAVSLVVGGIGIMNIMLVSVTERTREIGVRMAVGATEANVKWQFLSEALVLSSLGGIIGIIVGMGFSALISNSLGWPTLVSKLSIVVAVVFSALVGVSFGFYPAVKAAQLNPIEALRYE